jgi:uncharacterized protein YjbI with pentapeptide repeats
MNQDKLNKILKSHKLWLDTEGEEGEQADFSRADLIGIDLTGAKGITNVLL